MRQCVTKISFAYGDNKKLMKIMEIIKISKVTDRYQEGNLKLSIDKAFRSTHMSTELKESYLDF